MTPEQERLLVMLEELVGLFREHGLTYYVAGGTTLGAVRHRRFIPWDDDIDIMMPYPDWCALVEIARVGGLPEDRVLNCLELDIDYPHVFGRYTDTTSCAIHYNQLLGGTPEGFIIDIFILDPVPDAHEGFARHRKVLSLYNDLANDFGYSYPMTEDRALLRRYSRRVKQEGRRAVLDELARELCQHDIDECDYLVMRWAAAPRLFKKDIYAFERYEEFEGLSVSVPGKCADYLVQHYGDDWMYVPGDSGRITHDAITFLDVDYATVQSDYLPFVDVERAREAFLRRRAYHIYHMGQLNRAKGETARIYATFAQAETLRRAAASAIDVRSALDTADRGVLDWVFGEFYRCQNMPELAGREEYLTINRYYDPVYIDIGDDLLEVALLNLIDTNRVGKAARILEIRNRAAGDLPDGLNAVRSMLDAVRLTRSLEDLGLVDEADDMADSVLEKRPANFSARTYLCERLLDQKSFSELRSVAEKGLEYYPFAGEFEKFLADCLYDKAASEGDFSEAFRKYGDALEKTTYCKLADDVRSKASLMPKLVDKRLESLLAGSFQGAVQNVPGPQVSYDAEALGGKVANLLAELGDICSRNEIEHYLGCQSARLAYVFGDNRVGLPVLDLYVPAGQFEQLACAIEREMPEMRALDYWKTNKNHLGYQMDYVDKTTTYIQLDEGFNVSEHGVKVTITPIRRRSTSRKGQALDVLETGWELNGYALTQNITAKRLAYGAAGRAGMVFGRRQLAHRLYDSLNAEYGAPSGKGGSLYVRLPHGEKRVFDASSFANCETVEFCSHVFPVVSGMQDLLARWVSPDWREDTRAMAPSFKNALVSADLPYEEFLEVLASEGRPLNSLFSLMKRVRLNMLPLANDLRIRNKTMAIARRSEERKRIYDELDSRSGDIEQALEREDYDELAQLFSNYDEAARRYLKRGLGLCPSKYHLDILCSIWNRRGDSAIADKLQSLAPVAHWQPLGG